METEETKEEGEEKKDKEKTALSGGKQLSVAFIFAIAFMYGNVLFSYFRIGMKVNIYIKIFS
jgi:hypothetical protein